MLELRNSYTQEIRDLQAERDRAFTELAEGRAKMDLARKSNFGTLQDDEDSPQRPHTTRAIQCVDIELFTMSDGSMRLSAHQFLCCRMFILYPSHHHHPRIGR